MADKSIFELTLQTTFASNDRLIVGNYANSDAEAITGQTLVNLLATSLDGHGGIHSIEKTGSSGTNPVVDTYTITMADRSTATFTVTNGLKGDRGLQTFIYFRWAHTQPSAWSDTTDQPDEWMGVYAGTATSPPTSVSSYTWVKVRGDTGETGAASAITGQSVSYIESTSGTIVPSPSGGWSPTVPSVTPGNFLWTRTQLTFNDGTTVISYSVSRFGIDGAGSVSTVNGLSPDSNGNITVSASDIQMQDSTSVEANIGTIQTNLITREKSQLYNKKFLVIGDSWCSSWDGTQDLTPWATRLATNTGAITENHAFPGSGFVAKGQLNKDFSEAIQLYPGGDYDAIIVQGGVNDISSDPSDNTIATAVSNFATTCRTMYPNVDIYYIATAPCKNLTSNETRIVSALTQNAKVNYITVCTDLLDIGSVDTSYQGDTTHLSDAGYSEFARCVAQFLTGGTAKPKKGFLYAPSYTQIYPRTTVSSTGSVTLSASVDAFDAVIVFVYNGSGTADRKSFFIPSIGYGGRSDVSWNATDSTSWYAIITLTFSGTSMNVNKCEISGFSAIQVSVYGVKFRI